MSKILLGIGQINSKIPEVFCKKGFLRNFAKFSGKTPVPVTCARLATLLKKRLWHRCFSCHFCEIFINTFFHRTPLVVASEIRFLNIGYESESQMFGSNLSHSIIFEGKYLFLKNLLLTFIKGLFLDFLIGYVVDGLRIKVKRKNGVHFLLFCKKVIIYKTTFYETTLYWSDFIFRWKESLKTW